MIVHSNLKLRDVITVRTMPGWTEQAEFTITGEVRFPGVYPLNKNERLSLIDRAGGVTDDAFLEGAVM